MIFPMQQKKLIWAISGIFLLLSFSLLRTAYLHDQWRGFWITIIFLTIAGLCAGYLLNDKR